MNEILSHVALKDYDCGLGKGPFIEPNPDDDESGDSEDDMIEKSVEDMQDISTDEEISSEEESDDEIGGQKDDESDEDGNDGDSDNVNEDDWSFFWRLSR